MSKPIPMAILVSGWDTHAGKQMREDESTAGRQWKRFKHVPLSNMLRDRVRDEQVFHGQSDAMSVLAIYSQPEFGDAIISMADTIIESVDNDREPVLNLINAECRTGFHRATTYGNTLAEVLNGLEDPPGVRRFNCQVFSTIKYTRRDAITKQIQSAIDFVERDDPHLMPGGASRDRSTLYGYSAVAQRAASEAVFKRIWDRVDEYNKWAATHYINDLTRDEPPVQRERSRSPRPELSQDPKLHLTAKAMPAKAMPMRLKAERLVASWTPVPPPPPPQVRRMEPTEPPPSCAKTWENIATDSDVARSWSVVMDEYKVDAASQHGLFALAQSSPEGRHRAFAIMSKLFKKKADGEVVSNSSAFVWSAVKNSWDAMGWNS